MTTDARRRDLTRRTDPLAAGPKLAGSLLTIFSLARAVPQSFFVFVWHATALSVAGAWLWAQTRGNLLLTMLTHAAVNPSKDIAASAVPGGTSAFGLSTSHRPWLTVAVSWAPAAYFLVCMPSIDAGNQP